MFFLNPVYVAARSLRSLRSNYRLEKIGYVPNDLCPFCGIESETVHHLFYECFFTNLIWNDFTSFWYLVSGERVDLTLQDGLVN